MTYDPQTDSRIYNRTCEEAIIDPNLAPGDYAVRLTVRLAGQTWTLARIREFTIQQQSGVTAAQADWELYNRAKDLALIFKDNFDKKLDTLNRNVSGVGQGLGGLSAGLRVQLRRAEIAESETRPIWLAIKSRTDAMTVTRLEQFLTRIFCPPGVTADPQSARLIQRLGAAPSFNDIESYELLRTAVQAFMIQECGVVIQAPRDPATGDIDNTQQIPGAIPPLTFADAQQRLTNLLQATSGRLRYIDTVVRQIFQDGIPAGQ